MKAAPIIHTRTYHCDFNPEFAARPKAFLDSDVKWARKTVLEATSSIDNLKGERWVIADNGKYRLAGVVGFLKNICAKCDLPDDIKASSEELFYDDKGRLIYAFIGVVVRTADADLEANSKITYDYLWQTFFNIMQPRWKSLSYQETIKTDFEPSDIHETDIKKPDIECKKIGQRKMYESNEDMDYDLFHYYFIKKPKSELSFCSNITDINDAKKTSFSIITTSANIITRLERETASARALETTPQPSQQSNASRAGVGERDDSKKKVIIIGTAGVLIVVGIILILVKAKV